MQVQNNTNLFIQIIDYTIPLFGNKRIFPYFTLKVNDGEITKIVKTKEDGHIIYFTFNRKRYRVFNDGTLYNQKIRFENYKK